MSTYKMSIWYADWSLDTEPQVATGLSTEQADMGAGAFIRGGVRKLVVEAELGGAMNYQERIEWFRDYGYHVDLIRRPRNANESAVVQITGRLTGKPMLYSISTKGDYKLVPVNPEGVQELHDN